MTLSAIVNSSLKSGCRKNNGVIIYKYYDENCTVVSFILLYASEIEATKITTIQIKKS